MLGLVVLGMASVGTWGMAFGSALGYAVGKGNQAAYTDEVIRLLNTKCAIQCEKSGMFIGPLGKSKTSVRIVDNHVDTYDSKGDYVKWLSDDMQIRLKTLATTCKTPNDAKKLCDTLVEGATVAKSIVTGDNSPNAKRKTSPRHNPRPSVQ